MRLIRLLLAASAAALATLAAVLAVAPAATAATLMTEARCYQEGADVVAAGSGFAPGAFVALSLDGQALGLGATDGQGIFRNKFVAPSLPDGKDERLHALVASDTLNTATTHFRTTEISAGFSPGTGISGSLRVRFHVQGFGIYKSDAKVYLHYVRPNGKLRRTIYLRKARGACGNIRRTRKRLLFPFVAERGVWKLQFDTRRVYDKATAQSNFAWVRTPVQVGT